MKLQLSIAAVVLLALSLGSAQVASHPPTVVKPKPVAKVNGMVLTDRDLLGEMYAIFPYARQHNGFPKAMEAEIRKGALGMIIFEELVYQEALRTKMAVPAVRLQKAEAEFRKQFASRDQYQEFLKNECEGSPQVLRQKIRRSLLIEAMLQREVQNKSAVSLAETKTYYEQNSKLFEHGEKFSIQTISIIPPANGNPEVQKEARRRAEEALRQAKATKTYRDFGLLAEKISEDDWRVNMGDRKQMDAAQLPPPLVAAARKMKPGEVSDLLQFGPNYTLFRLNGHIAAGRSDFASVRADLRTNLQKAKYERIRTELNTRLRKSAKVEVF